MKTLKEIKENVEIKMKEGPDILDDPRYKDFDGFVYESDGIISKVPDVFNEMFDTLNEGSGVISNSISIGLVKSLKKLNSEVKRTRDVGKKCDLLSVMVTIIGGLVLVSIGVSGDKKGILSKGMSLLSIVTGLRTRR
jgi:uncharacterized membrane protein